jgi:uncharacterized protein YecA (UPF0149 family)
MDTRSGQIYTQEQLDRMSPESRALLQPHLATMHVAPTQAQLRRRRPRVGRNEPCPCGSGLKFKRCCLK